MIDLCCFRVQSVTDEVFYIPEFVTLDEENYLIRKVMTIIHSYHESLAKEVSNTETP